MSTVTDFRVLRRRQAVERFAGVAQAARAQILAGATMQAEAIDAFVTGVAEFEAAIADDPIGAVAATEDRIVGRREAARHLGVSETTLGKMVGRNEIPVRRLPGSAGGTIIRYSLRELDEYARGRSIHPRRFA